MALYDICSEYQKKLTLYEKEHKKIEKKLSKVKKQDLDHPLLINHNHLNNKMSRVAIISIVFAVMAIEDFINKYTYNHFSKDYVKENLEKLSLPSKLIIIPRLITGNEIPSECKAFQMFIELTKVRNKIVHYKADYYNPPFDVEKNLKKSLAINETVIKVGKSSKNVID